MTHASRFDPVTDVLARALEQRASPAIVLEAGREGGVIWRKAFGRLTYDEDAPPAAEDTIFDLASLTKVIATASLAMRLVDNRQISLAETVSAHLPCWQGADRGHVTLRDLLEHCGGLAGWAPLYVEHTGRAAFQHAIASAPLAYAPWTRSIYSDLGFMLLGFALEDAAGASLDRMVAQWAPPGLRYGVHQAERSRVAPTERRTPDGDFLTGEAHDENARALGAAAAHAGMFGTVDAVGAFARLVLRTWKTETPLGRPETLRRFATRSTVPGSSRALGWDTMLPTSSCGTLLSDRAIGHTGFTGTSLWVDPARDLYVVLLTNRVHPTRENKRWLEVRPAVHDAIVRTIS